MARTACESCIETAWRLLVIVLNLSVLGLMVFEFHAEEKNPTMLFWLLSSTVYIGGQSIRHITEACDSATPAEVIFIMADSMIGKRLMYFVDRSNFSCSCNDIEASWVGRAAHGAYEVRFNVWSHTFVANITVTDNDWSSMEFQRTTSTTTTTMLSKAWSWLWACRNDLCTNTEHFEIEWKPEGGWTSAVMEDQTTVYRKCGKFRLSGKSRTRLEQFMCHIGSLYDASSITTTPARPRTDVTGLADMQEPLLPAV